MNFNLICTVKETKKKLFWIPGDGKIYILAIKCFLKAAMVYENFQY